HRRGGPVRGGHLVDARAGPVPGTGAAAGARDPAAPRRDPRGGRRPARGGPVTFSLLLGALAGLRLFLLRYALRPPPARPARPRADWPVSSPRSTRRGAAATGAGPAAPTTPATACARSSAGGWNGCARSRASSFPRCGPTWR